MRMDVSRAAVMLLSPLFGTAVVGSGGEEGPVPTPLVGCARYLPAAIVRTKYGVCRLL